ncbi:unnamed protein product, partial [Ectocarpus sp. 12 AP-2014]
GKEACHPRAALNGHLAKYDDAQGSGNLRTISVSSIKVRSNRVQSPVMLLFTLGASTRASSGIGRKKGGNLQSE